MVEILALGQRVRHARQQAGLTLEDLSQQVGVTASQLSLVETGKREAKISLLSSLASALSVEVSELLDETPPNERARLEREWAAAQSSSLVSSLACLLCGCRSHSLMNTSPSWWGSITSWCDEKSLR